MRWERVDELLRGLVFDGGDVGGPLPASGHALARGERAARRSRQAASPPIRVAIVAAGARGERKSATDRRALRMAVVQASGTCQA